MSPLAFYRELLANGVPEDTAFKMASEFEANREAEIKALCQEMLAGVVPSRSKRQERNARYYDGRRLKASEKRLNQTNSDDSDAKRLNAEPAKDAPTHVRDNLPRLVTAGNSAAASSADDWPNEKPGGIAKHLASLAGPGLADIAKSPGLTTTAGEIIRWKQLGCSWEQDVVPVIQGRTSRPRPSPVGSWNLFTNDVLAAKARRERIIEVPEATGPPVGSFSAQRAADNAESTRRALELLKANG